MDSAAEAKEQPGVQPQQRTEAAAHDGCVRAQVVSRVRSLWMMEGTKKAPQKREVRRESFFIIFFMGFSWISHRFSIDSQQFHQLFQAC